jgi:two-component system, chemotaxis family, CheB/CheR fusion protein
MTAPDAAGPLQGVVGTEGEHGRPQSRLPSEGAALRSVGTAAGWEAEAAAPERRMKRVMQIETVGIVFFDSSGRLLECNDAFLRMSGLKGADVYDGRVGWQDITPPEWHPAGRRAMEEFAETGRVTGFEKEYVRPDGSRWWGLFSATRGEDGEGMGYVVDVTERRRAEAGRRATEAEFRAMFELSSVGQFQADLATGNIVRANVRFCEIVGYSSVELARMRMEELTHAEDRTAIASMLERLVQGHAQETAFETRLMRRDGGMVWIEGNLTLMRDDAGAPVRMVAIVRDVSAQKGTEQALAESRERLRLILESARDYAIISTDLQRRVTSWNPGAERISGYTEAEVLGQSADLIFTPEDLERGDAKREAHIALTTGRAANERWHRRKDGSRFWGSGVMMAMLDARGLPVGMVKIFRDETDARKSSEALKRSREQLWEALRENERARDELQAASRAKDHFLAVLSHELRTPLTPVLMAAQALGMRHDLPEGVRPALEMIQRNVRIEASFIDDLLDLTRISRGRMEIVPEPTDLHAAVESAIAACQPIIDQKRIRLEVGLDAGRHDLNGDRHRLQQAMRNVVKNAAKFTPEEGQIWISTENPGDGNLFRLTVGDSGIGIEADHITTIFEAFSQGGEWVAREYGGLGLGLAIAKATIEAHGGSILASSEGKDRGTTLTIEIPLTRQL